MAVLMIVTNVDKMKNTDHPTGWYLGEAAHPYKVFKDAGLEITVASPKGGKAPLDPSSVDAYKDDAVCKGLQADKQFMDLFENTTAIANVDLAKYKVIFFVGGHGPMFDLPNCEVMNKATATIYEKGGIVAAVCHGVAGLVNVKLPNGQPLVKGKKLTCFTNQEEDIVKLSSVMPFMLETALVEKGAHFIAAAAPFGENVQVSERICTGQNPASATGLAQEIIKKMKELKFL